MREGSWRTGGEGGGGIGSRGLARTETAALRIPSKAALWRGGSFGADEYKAEGAEFCGGILIDRDRERVAVFRVAQV
jgi:hypothetical protein